MWAMRGKIIMDQTGFELATCLLQAGRPTGRPYKWFALPSQSQQGDSLGRSRLHAYLQYWAFWPQNVVFQTTGSVPWMWAIQIGPDPEF